MHHQVKEHIEQHVEAMIFASDKPVKPDDMVSALEKIFTGAIDPEVVRHALVAIERKYSAPSLAIGLVRSGGGYQFLTKADYHESVAALLHLNARRKLTNAALETLAIIAYRQPVTKTEIEQIRGVNSDYTVNKLMEKELVEITGRSKDPGRPLLYGTSAFFMDYFGINSIEELPQLKEFTETESQIGVLPDVEKISDN